MPQHPTTMKDIAKQLGTSVSTVSRALQDHPRIGNKMKEQVKALAKSLAYIPNSTAIHLKKQKSGNIGVVLPFLTEEFFSVAITGIEDILVEKGYRVIVQQSRNNYDRECTAVRALMEHGVDGIIVSVAAETYNHSHFLEVNQYGIPLIFFDRVIKSLPNSCVYSDISVGAFEAVAFLLEKGLQKIALLNGPITLQATNERLQGYVEAMKQYGVPIRPQYIKGGGITTQDTIQKMEELLSLAEPPQAILAFHDYVALDAMEVCKKRGLRINQDIFFVSFSNLSFCKYLEQPPIASIEQFPYQMGAKAAQLLLSAFDSPETYIREEVIIKSKLVAR